MQRKEKVSSSCPLVILDFADLTTEGLILTDDISAAYGNDGLGILCVRNVPNYVG
jgi:hypothetical protein